MGSTKSLIDGKWRYVHEDGTLGDPCSPPTDEERANEEQRKKYQAKADETGREVWWRGERFLPSDPLAADAAKALTADANNRKTGTKTYKVLTQRDEWFMGKFSPDKLEAAVNHYAEQGWVVVGVATADVGAFWGSFMGGQRQEIVVFMERPADG